ncbi:MAG: hypothetical protein M3O70_16540, partial [Actinomycetota bacterium]|nr:hypothetical protein [Actinomycetota bacterium]
AAHAICGSSGWPRTSGHAISGMIGRRSAPPVPIHVDESDDYCAALNHMCQAFANVIADSDDFICDPDQNQSHHGNQRTKEESREDVDALCVALLLVLHTPIIHCVARRPSEYPAALARHDRSAACACDG